MSGFVALFEAARVADGLTFCFSGKDLLLDAAGRLPDVAAVADLGAPQHEHVIGRCGELRYRLQVWPADLALPTGWCKADFRKAWVGLPQEMQPALGRARQLAVWLAETRYCGACGEAMQTDAVAAVRRCPACGFVAYPRLSPVGMVLIGRGDEVLLARAPHFQPGVYSALAGYVEAGESVEACIAREVQEEVGLRIDNLRWFGSQSWALSNAMMLGFTADYAGGELVLQAEEIEDARWFRRDALPGLPHASTLAGRMIRAWAAR
ncbi:MAG: NAD(+) diphosphatase [Pseudomonadota bacterium]